MFYDSVYVLSDLFQRFLLDNPDVQEDGHMAGSGADVTQRLEGWLERETTVTDWSHKATLMQLASSHEGIMKLRDTLVISTGL